MADWPTRDVAQAVLNEWTRNGNLKKHAYAVEAAMRAYARRLGEDEEKWGVLGLLHDFDYERYPDLPDHPARGAEFLREQGYPEELVQGVLAHAEHTHTPRDTAMKRAVFAVDELTGLIVAVALVRPSKKLSEVTVDAVLRKWPEKRFAAGVDRSLAETGAREMGVTLGEHIGIVLAAMQAIAADLGL